MFWLAAIVLNLIERILILWLMISLVYHSDLRKNTRRERSKIRKNRKQKTLNLFGKEASNEFGPKIRTSIVEKGTNILKDSIISRQGDFELRFHWPLVKSVTVNCKVDLRHKLFSEDIVQRYEKEKVF